MAGDSDFQFGMIGEHVIALVHTANNPSDEAWEGHFQVMYEAVGQDRFVELGYFVITAGGAPSARQRRTGNQRVRGRKMNRSIVTESFFVRQLVKSWSWFAPGLLAFAPDELRAAMQSVGIRAEDVDLAWPKVVALNAALATPVPWVPDVLPQASVSRSASAIAP
jgi:hypothetical protein